MIQFDNDNPHSSSLAFCCVCNEEPVYLDPETGAPSEFCSPHCYKDAVPKNILPACEFCGKLPKALFKNGKRAAICSKMCQEKFQKGFAVTVPNITINAQNFEMPNFLNSSLTLHPESAKVNLSRRSSNSSLMSLMANAAITVGDLTLPTSASNAFRDLLHVEEADTPENANSTNNLDRPLSNEQEVSELPDFDESFYKDPIRESMQDFSFASEEESNHYESLDCINDPLHPEIEIFCANILTETEFSDTEFEGGETDEFVDAEFDNKRFDM
ncbi:9797_t:CDS:1 [Ambispora gerdemannii]|uniref:9797_t:CDS:1 n=1 Tax=Ambispora gerdemannii TaxID=144530 RepID=A0A9N9C6P6_9GLOM|nr:9797_t:CDS:1 [Ambispora gerdemannii]